MCNQLTWTCSNHLEKSLICGRVKKGHEFDFVMLAIVKKKVAIILRFHALYITWIIMVITFHVYFFGLHKSYIVCKFDFEMKFKVVGSD